MEPCAAIKIRMGDQGGGGDSDKKFFLITYFLTWNHGLSSRKSIFIVVLYQQVQLHIVYYELGHCLVRFSNIYLLQ